MSNERICKTIAVCDTQPVTSQGLRLLIDAAPDLRCVGTVDSLAAGLDLARGQRPDVLLTDKAFGAQAVLEWIAAVCGAAIPTAVVVWGVSLTEAEALRLMQAGAKGIVRKTADCTAVLACLRTVASGGNFMEEHIFRQPPRSHHHPHSGLTPREQQVMDLVEQGLKNREIAHQLGIRPGTVKIHLKHIFEKTGVRGRYGLALAGLQEKGVLNLSGAA